MTSKDVHGADDWRGRLTPSDVHHVLFSRAGLGRRGYDETEVDVFLERVQQELVRLIDEKAVLRAEVSGLKAQLAHGGSTAAKGVGSSDEDEAKVHAVRLIAAAQQTADAYAADAERYGKQLISEARSASEQMVAEARQAAQRILQEAQLPASGSAARCNEGGVEATAASRVEELDGQGAYLETFGEVVRVQLRAYLEALLRDVDAEWDRVSPGAVLSRPAAPQPTGEEAVSGRSAAALSHAVSGDVAVAAQPALQEAEEAVSAEQAQGAAADGPADTHALVQADGDAADEPVDGLLPEQMVEAVAEPSEVAVGEEPVPSVAAEGVDADVVQRPAAVQPTGEDPVSGSPPAAKRDTVSGVAVVIAEPAQPKPVEAVAPDQAKGAAAAGPAVATAPEQADGDAADQPVRDVIPERTAEVAGPSEVAVGEKSVIGGASEVVDADAVLGVPAAVRPTVEDAVSGTVAVGEAMSGERTVLTERAQQQAVEAAASQQAEGAAAERPAHANALGQADDGDAADEPVCGSVPERTAEAVAEPSEVAVGEDSVAGMASEPGPAILAEEPADVPAVEEPAHEDAPFPGEPADVPAVEDPAHENALAPGEPADMALAEQPGDLAARKPAWSVVFDESDAAPPGAADASGLDQLEGGAAADMPEAAASGDPADGPTAEQAATADEGWDRRSKRKRVKLHRR